MPTSIPTAIVSTRLEPFAREVARTYANRLWSTDQLYSVLADALRLIARIAKQYTDPSCVELSTDELEAEGRRKLIEVFQGKNGVPSKLTTMKSRVELFAWIKTCVNNHARGLVHRHRFTAKRTGERPPPRGSAEMKEWHARPKPEVSLDAVPEVRSALEFMTVPLGTGDVDDDMASTLTPVEFLVYQELTAPSRATLELASHDALRAAYGHDDGLDVKLRAEHYATALGMGILEFEDTVTAIQRKFDAYRAELAVAQAPMLRAPAEARAQLTPMEFLVYQQLTSPNLFSVTLAKARSDRMRSEYLAAGMGMELSTFIFLVGSIKLKIEKYMENPDTLREHNAAVTALERIFDVQVPRSLDALIVRRLFTIAARSQYERVTPDVATLLRSVGAEVPAVNSQGNLTCFGVLFAKNHSICAVCTARAACELRARNSGLDSITISPTLLSARAMVRTPEAGDSTASTTPVNEAVPATAVAAAPAAPAARAVSSPTSEREEAIRSHLESRYKHVECYGEHYFKHRVPRRDERVKHIVWVGAKPDFAASPNLNPAFLVRVCGARPQLQKQLIRVGLGWYIPESMGVGEVIEFIDAHANYLFKVKA